ncbi:hypothetical protein 031MP004_13 [Bacillus phage 031MP004]|nr:hypothetical protein 022DV001_13 [Bacillus phage 022DV001]QFG05591.1 hypothetical protein 031MP004_13 [Bacillus phage 031MP004]QFG05765.1 hypothetical protein 055SW001_13 [Bacillus phage 055SW001]
MNKIESIMMARRIKISIDQARTYGFTRINQDKERRSPQDELFGSYPFIATLSDHRDKDIVANIIRKHGGKVMISTMGFDKKWRVRFFLGKGATE